MTISLSNMGNVLRRLGALAGVIVTVSNSCHLPANVRATLLAVSGILLSVDHAVANSSSTTNTTTPGAPQ
jgi:phosphate starvation-inducible protein PhoH